MLTALHSKINRIYDKIRHVTLWEGERPGLPGFADFREIVVINSCSRSGSSLLFNLLASHPDVISPNGEEVPFYKLAGIGFVHEENDSDCLAPDLALQSESFQRLEEGILGDLGLRGKLSGNGRTVDLSKMACDFAKRILLQWTDLDLDPEMLHKTAAAVLQEEISDNSDPDNFPTENYWFEFLSALMRQGYPVNPYYYDIPADRIRSWFPLVEVPGGPPCREFTLEEPPFIVPKPEFRVTVDDARGKILLLKSSIDAFRISFLTKLFPNAGFKFVHLIRNPAASINGLMDGWLYRGFFSHNLASVARLNIRGYSEKSKWGSLWWNFHLPPFWANHINEPLEEVCAYQWETANKAILDDIRSGVIKDCIAVKYENLIASLSSKRVELRRILDFAELRPDPFLELLEDFPTVMAVRPPYRGKWKARGEQIKKLVLQSNMSELAEQLGYSTQEMEEWP